MNPHDHKVRAYGLCLDGKPYVIAKDVAGEVVKLGSGQTTAKVADASLTDNEATMFLINDIAVYVSISHLIGLTNMVVLLLRQSAIPTS